MTEPLGMEELELCAYDAVFNLVDEAASSYGVPRADVACIFAGALEKLSRENSMV